MRKVTQSGYADYIPVFLSETQKLYRSGVLPCNVAMIQVSPPDAHGYVSLGTSVDATLAAVECAQTVIAVINKHVPRSFGDAFIHVDDIDLFVQDDTPLEEAHFSEPNEVETAIGKHCAALIEDGACLQMGIGAIPNAVLAQLGGHKNLGIHTEMFADGVLPLVESGVINGRNKAIDKGKMVSTFLMGSQKVYDFIDNNPGVAMMDVGYTNDPFVIAKNPKVTAINSALQVDLTGQICADSLGTKFYSGVGGQIDFIYGASRSEGGKAILAMPSTTNKGISKIAPELTLGAGVVTTRSHVHWFVTEYGAVNLYGRSLQERARLIISVVTPTTKRRSTRGFRALRRASPLHQGDDFRKKINTTPEQKNHMRSGRLRTACGFFLPCTTSRDANILDKAFRSTGKPFGPALSGHLAVRSPPRGRLCRRRPSLPPSPSYAGRRPVPCKQRPQVCSHSEPTGSRPYPMTSDGRFRSARRLHQISRSPASDGRRPPFSSAAPDRQTGASHRSRRSYRYTESDCCRISYPARHGPSPDKS